LFGYHRMPSTTTPTAMRLCTGGTTCSATAECRTDNAHRAAAPHRRCRLSWLPPDAEHHNACRAAAPHWRCRLLGYSQTPNGTTPFGLRPPLKPHNHPCKSEFVTWGGVYHGRRRQVKMFFTSCIVPHLVGKAAPGREVRVAAEAVAGHPGVVAGPGGTACQRCV
jgi:hypothetical protein